MRKAKKMMRLSGYAILLFVFFSATGLANNKSDSTIEGEYSVIGSNPNGVKYRGKVTISKQGKYYMLKWKIGKDSYQGRGLISGKTLTVNWGAVYPVIYKIRGNGVLKGSWDNGRAKETLTPVKQ